MFHLDLFHDVCLVLVSGYFRPVCLSIPSLSSSISRFLPPPFLKSLDAFVSQPITQASIITFSPNTSSLVLKMDNPSQNHGASPANDTTAKETSQSVGMTSLEGLAFKHGMPVPLQPIITNPVLPPNLPVNIYFHEELSYGMIHTDRLISFQSAYKL